MTLKQKSGKQAVKRSFLKRLLFLGLASFCLLNANFSYSQIPESERDALLSVYNATNGGSWTNNTGWNGAAGTECSWFGIICSGGSDDLSRNVTNLNVNSNQLSGTVPNVFAGLPYLTEFNVLNNSLTGSLPSSFGSAMSNLELGSNQFTGTVPASYGNLPNLVFLGLWNNQLTGPAPDSVVNKSGLDLRTENAFTNIANMAPSASITQVCSGDPPACATVTGGALSVEDSDDAVGETVSVTAVASDSDGIATGQFLVGGSVVATGQSASISLPDGTTVVTFKATDDDGASATTTVSITVAARPSNVAPSVTITDGDRAVTDTNMVSGETVSFTGTATDSDGTIATTQWLVGGSVVATGTSANLSLSDGTTVVTFKATDNRGGSSSVTASIMVKSYEQIPQSERDILISIYNATNGGSWTNNTGWNGAAGAECSWYGVTCSGGNVTNLNLNSNQLSGTVPDVFAGLPYLTEFNVLNNSLTGSLPSSFGSAMSNLELGSNQFTGTVPASYGDLPNLVFLGLWNNQLTGPPPDSVVNKSGLDLRTENAFTNIANMAPSASITQVCDGDPPVCTTVTGGDRTVADTDYEAGETVSVVGVVSDSDGTVPTTQWLVGGSVVSTNTGSASISLPDGTTVVTFKATDDDGASATTTVSITVTAPVPQDFELLRANISGSNSSSKLNFSASVPDGELSLQWKIGPSGFYHSPTTASSEWVTYGFSYDAIETNVLALVTQGCVDSYQEFASYFSQFTGQVFPVDLSNVSATNYCLDSQVPVSEREALIALYNATGGDNWTNNTGWNGPAGTECTWYGVICDSDGLNVTGLVLHTNQLSGTFPDVLAGLPELTDLNVLNNSLTGPLPSSFPDFLNGWVKLRTAEFGGNQFTGEIPASYLTLPYLTYLGLSNNQLTGPASLALLLKIVKPNCCALHTGPLLDLRIENAFANEGPPTVSLISALSSTDQPLSNNLLAYSSESYIEKVLRDRDKVEGELIDFRVLAFDSHGGAISTTEWIVDGEVVAIGEIAFNGNQKEYRASFRVPDGETTVFIRVTDDDGESTTLTVSFDVKPTPTPIPQSARDALMALYNSTDGGNWRNNTGWLGAAGTECSWYGVTCYSEGLLRDYPENESIRGIILSSNNLKGFIPSELGNLTQLKSLFLNNNQLSGAIPTELANLTVLTSLILNDNFLTGPLPQWVSDMAISALNVTDAFNAFPVVAISGGNRTIADSDDIAGEPVSFTGTLTDSDGTIGTTQWLVGGSVVATGLTPIIPLPNGVTVVTFKAIQSPKDLPFGCAVQVFIGCNEGLWSVTTSVTITVKEHYIPTEEWPAPYNGVTPNSSWGLEFNNIGTFLSGRLYSCVRIFTDGLPASVNGIGQFDISFTQQFFTLRIKFSNSREFNAIGALNENGELPDCSGKFETTTGVYTDIYQYGDGYHRKTYILTDPDNLIFTLEKMGDLCRIPQTLELDSCDYLSTEQELEFGDQAA